MKLRKFNRTLFGAMMVAGVMGIASQAHAAGYCSGGMATEGIGAGDVTFNSVGADDCYGVVAGNITGSGAYDGAPILNAMNWGAGWTFFGDSSPSASGSYMGLSFTVAETGSGTWTLTGTDDDPSTPLSFPVSLDLVVALKGGTDYALWGFDDVSVDGSDNGTYSIVFTNKGGKVPDLSHMVVFGREAGGGTITPIPEADTYAMLLAGLGLVGFAARRKLA